MTMSKHPTYPIGKRARRAMGKYIRGNVDELLTTATLASRTLVTVAFDETVNERTFVSSIVARYSMDNFTPGAGLGPAMIGVAHGDYTNAEIEAWVENTGSWNEGDLVSQEIGKRRVRMIGIFGDGSGGATDKEVLNDGKAIKTKLGWTLLQGQTLSLWVYNLGSGAFVTSTPNFHCEGHVNLWPL